MRKRSVAKIVQKCGKSHKTCILGGKPEYLAKKTADVKNPQCVLEASMQCSRIDQIGEGKLADSAEPLESSGRHDLGFLPGHPNEAVNRVSNCPRLAHYETFPPNVVHKYTQPSDRRRWLFCILPIRAFRFRLPCRWHWERAVGTATTSGIFVRNVTVVKCC